MCGIARVVADCWMIAGIGEGGFLASFELWVLSREFCDGCRSVAVPVSQTVKRRKLRWNEGWTDLVGQGTA